VASAALLGVTYDPVETRVRFTGWSILLFPTHAESAESVCAASVCVHWFLCAAHETGHCCRVFSLAEGSTLFKRALTILDTLNRISWR
jgi:hypothetical protein